MEARAVLLVAGLRGLPADNAETGAAALGLVPSVWHTTLAALLREKLIRDPIRLEDQALQCHWRLELTPAGVARARTLTGA